MVRRFAGEPIAVLCEYHMDASSSHEVPHQIHAWPLQAGTALSRVYYLLEDLVACLGSVGSQGFYLLGQRVARADLLVRGDAGVEYGPLWAVAVCARHRCPLSHGIAGPPGTGQCLVRLCGTRHLACRRQGYRP